ncbi:hypothetical protein ScPMuIL_013930 [Solemya velum]
MNRSSHKNRNSMEAKFTRLWVFLSLLMLGECISHVRKGVERCLESRQNCDTKCVGKSGRAFLMCLGICKVKFHLCINGIPRLAEDWKL